MDQTKKPAVNSQLLVANGKSARLAAIAKKANGLTRQSNSHNKPRQVFVKGLNQQTKDVLQQANAAVEVKLADILNTYPPGKKNTFFEIKYGITLDSINVMAVKAVFLLLNIDSAEIRNFRIIENLTCRGEVNEKL